MKKEVWSAPKLCKIKFKRQASKTAYSASHLTNIQKINTKEHLQKPKMTRLRVIMKAQIPISKRDLNREPQKSGTTASMKAAKKDMPTSLGGIDTTLPPT